MPPDKFQEVPLDSIDAADFNTSASVFQEVSPETVNPNDFDFTQAQVASDVVFDEKRQQAFEVQPGLNGRETEHVIATQFEKKPINERFALTDLAVSFGSNFPKGLASFALQTPDLAAQYLKDLTRSGFDPTDPSIADINPLSIQKMSSILRAIKQTAELEPLSPAQEGIVSAVGEFQSNYRQTIADMGIKPDETKPFSKFFFDLGGASGSVLASVGAIYATRNPMVVGSLFGLLDASDTLIEGEAAGVPLRDRLAAGALVGTFTGWTEGLGGEIFLRTMKMDNILGKSFIRIASDAAQEALQQAGQGVVQETFKISQEELSTHLQDIMYAALLGALVSGPINISASVLEKHGFIKDLEAAGFSKEAAKTLAGKVSQQTLESKEVQTQVAEIFKSEFSPVSLTIEERSKEFKEVERVFEAELLKRTGQDLTAEPQDFSTAVEKVVSGRRRLTPAEIDAFPDLADFQTQLDVINEQLETVTDPEISESLTKRKEALLEPFSVENKIAKANEEIKQLKEMKKELEQTLSTEFAPMGQESLRSQIADVDSQIATLEKEKGRPLSPTAIKEAVTMKEADAKMVTESAALKRSLKRQEQIAREVTRVERNRILAAQQALRTIAKAVKAKNVAVEEKKQIEILADMSKKAKSLDDLRQLAAKVVELKKQGRAQVLSSKELKRARFDAQKRALLGQLGFTPDPVTGKYNIPVVAKLASTTQEDIAKAVALTTLTPSRLFDIVDGGKNFEGVFNKIFYGLVNAAQNDEIALAAANTAIGVETLKKYGIKSEELNSDIEVDGLVFRYQEVMYIYAGFNQEQTRRAIVFGNRINPLTVQKLVARLPQKFKNAADEIVGEMTAHFPRLQAAYMDLHDGAKELTPVKGPYLPMRRKIGATEDFAEELSAEAEDRAMYGRGLGDPSFTKARKDVKGTDQKAVNLHLWDLYIGHVAKREHFINMQSTLKELKALISDTEFRNALSQKHGAEMVKEFDKYLDRVAFPSAKSNHDALEKVSRGLRQRTAVLHLPLNIMVMANQVSSLPLFLGEVGPVDLVAAIVDMNLNFKERIAFIHSVDPQMRFRNIEKSIDEYMRAEPTKAATLRNKAVKAGFQGIEVVDKYVVSIGWWAKYSQMKKLGFSESEAINAAQRAVLRTQNASLPKDIPSMYATSEFLDMWLLFTNQLSKNYNMAVYDIPMRFRSDKKMDALLGFLGMALSYTIYWSLAHGRLPSDAEDLTEATLDGAIGIIPLFGPMINSWRKGFDGAPASLALVRTGWEGVEAVAEGEFGRAFDQATFFVAGGFKLPYTGIRRSIMGVSDLVTGETDDLRRLVYSEAALEE